MKKLYYIAWISLIFLNHSCFSDAPQNPGENAERASKDKKTKLEEREAEIIRQFDCDTFNYFEDLEFEYQKQEALKAIKKPLLFKFDLSEIFEKDDSTCILAGWSNWDNYLEIEEIGFSIKRSSLPDLKMFENTFCVVKNPTIEHYREKAYSKDDETSLTGIYYPLVLKGECIYIEQP